VVIICGIDSKGIQGEFPVCCVEHAHELANRFLDDGVITWWEIVDLESGLTVDSPDRIEELG
jgi:hypothetical protein